jgi:hypothetical protein
VEVADDWQRVTLTFPRGWSRTHPLTRSDLEQEAVHLRALGIESRIEEEAGAVRKTAK